VKIQFAHKLSKNCPLHRLEDLIKAYFFPQVFALYVKNRLQNMYFFLNLQLYMHKETSIQSDREVKIVIDLSRAGDEAQLKVETSEHVMK